MMGLASQLANQFQVKLISKFIVIISGAALTITLARLLGAEEYGMLFLAISVLGTIVLFSKLGIARSTARYIAKYKETDPRQIPHILRFSFKLNILTITIVCLILLFFNESIARIVGEPELVPFLIAGVFYIIGLTLSFYIRVILQGFEDIKASGAVEAVEKILILFFALGFVVLGFGAYGALAGYIIGFLFSAMVGSLYIYRTYFEWSKQSSKEPGLRRRIIEYSIPITVTNSSNVLSKRIDIVLVGFFIGPTAVAFYTLGKQIIEFVETPISALGFTLSPTYETQKSKGNDEIAARIYEESLLYGFIFYIPAAAGLILVSEPLVKYIFGNEYFGAVPVLQILAIFAIFRAITKLTSTGLDFLGQARRRAIIKSITSVINVAGNIILIPVMGVVGAAITTVVTHAIYALACFYLMSLEVNIRYIVLIRQLGIATIIAGLMSIPVYLSLDLVTNIGSLLAVILMGATIWAILSIMMGAVSTDRVRSIV